MMKRFIFQTLAYLPLLCSCTFKGHCENTKDSIPVKIAILHIFPVLNQITANINKLDSDVQQAFNNGARIVVGPELATTGYSITAQQVADSLGLRSPFLRLATLRNLAIKNKGYVVVGIAEIGSGDTLYNAALMFKPDGTYFLQRKRGVAIWNARGNLPFDVVSTPYGNIGIAICSDTYLMDWMRIMTIKGANIIITPANWWGDADQLDTWTTRTYENGVYMIVANRWGTETDNRFNPPYTYNMNDGPSAVVLPSGPHTIAASDQVALKYQSDQSNIPSDTILYYTIKVAPPFAHASNQTWMYAARQPKSYIGIANPYYRPDSGNLLPPGLPSAGTVNVGMMSYLPSADYRVNLSNLYKFWGQSSKNAGILVLPSFEISVGPVDITNPSWYNASPWKELQFFVESNHIQLLVTSVYEKYSPNAPNCEAIIITRPNQQMRAIPAIHSWSPAKAAPVPPVYIDLDSARVGLVLDHDILMPETSLDLAKWGSDILLCPFDYGTTRYQPEKGTADNWPYNLFKTCSNIVCHIIASNDYGYGIMVRNGGGYIDSILTNDAGNGRVFQIAPFDSRTVRKKYLNAYYPFDLETLLSTKLYDHDGPNRPK